MPIHHHQYSTIFKYKTLPMPPPPMDWKTSRFHYHGHGQKFGTGNYGMWEIHQNYTHGTSTKQGRDVPSNLQRNRWRDTWRLLQSTPWPNIFRSWAWSQWQAKSVFSRGFEQTKRLPQFYGTAKGHKASPLSIPLCAVNILSVVAYKYIDHYLQKLIPYITGYTKNSTDVIKLLHEIDPPPLAFGALHQIPNQCTLILILQKV